MPIDSDAPRLPSDKDAICSAPTGPGANVLLTAREYDDDRNGAIVEETSAFRSDLELFYDLHTIVWDAEREQTLDARNDAVAGQVAWADPRIPEVQLVNRLEFADGTRGTLGSEILTSVESCALLARNRARFDAAAERTLYTLCNFGIKPHDHDDPAVVHEASVVHGERYDFVVAHDEGRYLALAQSAPGGGRFDGHRIGITGRESGPERSAWADVYAENDGFIDDNGHAEGNLDAAVGLHATELSSTEWLTAIGFGHSEQGAISGARAALDRGYVDERSAFADAWREWHADCVDPGLEAIGATDDGPRDGSATSDRVRDCYRRSMTALKCAEDGCCATIAGAFKPRNMSYRFVWPRDQVMITAALVAAGAIREAQESLQWFDRTQIEAEIRDERGIPRAGSWWQNYYVTDDPHWRDLQLDQVGGPIYAHWLVWRACGGGPADDRGLPGGDELAAIGGTDAATVRDAHYRTSRRAAEFLLAHDDGDRPAAHQDPWEEVWGHTTEGTAAAIAGLRCMAELAAAHGEPEFAARCRERAAMWAEGFGERFTRESEYGEHLVTALNPEPHVGPPADARPDAAAFMACWPWNVVDPAGSAIGSTLEATAHPDWNAPDADCLGRYPGDEYTPSNAPEPGGWPLCEAYADVARWRSGHDPDAVADHLVDATAWTTAAGLLPERVDGTGDPRWNANLSWSQATYVLLARSHATGVPFGLAPAS